MNEEILHRTFPLRLERSSGGRTLEGCAVPYGEAAQVSDNGGPAYYEAFEVGAFTRNLKAPARVELRFEHREGLTDIVGRALELSEESSGLYGSFRVFSGPIGDHALELIEEGVLPGLSVGFVPLRRGHPKRTAEGTIIRDLCHLEEVSLCRVPAYDRAIITQVRSAAVLRLELEIPAPPEDAQLERLRAVGIELE